MPRASQMPRSRALRAVRAGVVFVWIVSGVALLPVLLAVGTEIGSRWWGLLMYLVAAPLLGLVLRAVVHALNPLVERAHARDWQLLPDLDRRLPYGAGRQGEDVVLPTKNGVTAVLVVSVLAFALVVLGISSDDSEAAAPVLIIVFGSMGLACLFLLLSLAGTRVRLTRHGVETSTLPPRQVAWEQVPMISWHGSRLVLRSGSGGSEKVSIPAAALEVSRTELEPLVRSVRGW